MFGLGLSEIILITIVAIVVIGPKRLPEVAKALGKGYAEFKKALDGFKETVKIDDVITENKKENNDLKNIYEEKWKDTNESLNKESTIENNNDDPSLKTSSETAIKDEK
ncbi:MAG: twin-arginine translocase TatA/TatE family subunit [Deferribacterales bacterium]